MNLWGQIKIPFYFIATAVLLLAFNNCGAPIKALQNSYVFSSSKAGLFWPNETTTLTGSDAIVSALVLNDLDSDGQSESVFISDSKDHTSPVQKVIRIIDSESFTELLNIHGMTSDPSEKVEMFLIDLDQNGSEKELLYINEDGTKIIALDIFSDQPEKPRWELSLVEPINFSMNVEIYVLYGSDGSMQIYVGNNKVTMTSVGPKIVYSNQRVDGDWTQWSDWTSCSRMCGGGAQTRVRLCSSPTPQNGGDFCSGNATEVRSCNTEPCNITCPEGTHLVIDRCVGDNPDASGQGSSVGGSTGGVTGGTGGSGGGSCGSGKTHNPVTDSCVQTKIQCAIGNGGGTKTWNTSTNEYGPCTDLRCFFGRVPVDNKCLMPRRFTPGNDEPNFTVRSPDNMSVTALAHKFCSDRGYLKSYRYNAGGRRAVYINQNDNGNGGTISHYVQTFSSITCVK